MIQVFDARAQIIMIVVFREPSFIMIVVFREPSIIKLVVFRET